MPSGYLPLVFGPPPVRRGLVLVRPCTQLPLIPLPAANGTLSAQLGIPRDIVRLALRVTLCRLVLLLPLLLLLHC